MNPNDFFSQSEIKGLAFKCLAEDRIKRRAQQRNAQEIINES